MTKGKVSKRFRAERRGIHHFPTRDMISDFLFKSPAFRPAGCWRARQGCPGKPSGPRLLRLASALVRKGIVVPGPEDLVELREAAKGRGVLRERAPEVIADLSSFARPLSTTRWTERARHDRKALEDALTMSYRGERLPERRRLAGLESLDVTLSADILLLCHNSRP
jgi:hypothetical protein